MLLKTSMYDKGNHNREMEAKLKEKCFPTEKDYPDCFEVTSRSQKTIRAIHIPAVILTFTHGCILQAFQLMQERCSDIQNGTTNQDHMEESICSGTRPPLKKRARRSGHDNSHLPDIGTWMQQATREIRKGVCVCFIFFHFSLLVLTCIIQCA